MPMNELVRLGSLPQSALPSPDTTFDTASSLFRKLARDQKLTQRWRSLDKGPFKIWCDDFRPANVLMDEDLKIIGVVDWEFTYAAPVEFTYAPPWWLLIEKPEYWPDGLEDWCGKFERRLQTFLKAMIDHEDEAIRKGRLEDNAAAFRSNAR
ncbi:hypothetical protein BO70DRAFT_430722 [Aspergillus heteromorphus CBS 117.55]|uniref:Aminoglycoside phosphotransferase domain-containing protein n=1 Tax=Aspergillus heteromorphus CBS 117.55 TaxID=1448321 RepID=A0A317VPC0_9EURO|nr:uncharacterized protein BO70DRAFT_430722 [Aspergillus heteromorphus CBS 117.55]PWY76234.1 hypothetical protein BO70DRAFT_430722 [Aspergillus heteromorphus CBS 117.55]